MNVSIEPGKYVVAVSGGVDSMALLHMLAGEAGLELTVAHFDHGIRPDAGLDRELVQAAAQRLGLPFIYREGQLGTRASEALARRRRYEFLREVQQQTGAQAIITAHHQDDVLETVLLNLLRGTGRRGLSSLRSQPDLLRPLLGVSKAEILAYAEANQIKWREDSTNQDPRYRRNQVRKLLMPQLDAAKRTALIMYAKRAQVLNDEIDLLLHELLNRQANPQMLDRAFFIQLPRAVAGELLAAWLRRHNIAFDRPGIERLVVFAKTAQAGKQADVDAAYIISASKKHITLEHRPVTP